MRDLITCLTVAEGLAAVLVKDAAVVGPAFDLRGCNAAGFFVNVAASADVLDADDKFVLSVEDTDADPASPNAPLASGWREVPDLKLIGDARDVTDNAAKSLKIGVLSLKRFVRLKVTPVGAHAAGSNVRASIVKGHLQAEGKGW